MNNNSQVHIFINSADSFSRGKGYTTTADNARNDAIRAIADGAVRITVRELANPCKAYVWVIGSDFLNIEQGWRIHHYRGHCLSPCNYPG